MTDGVRTLTEAEAMNRESERRKARARAERREHIAARVLPALVVPEANGFLITHQVRQAIEYADRMLAELDFAEARDREATNA